MTNLMAHKNRLKSLSKIKVCMRLWVAKFVKAINKSWNLIDFRVKIHLWKKTRKVGENRSGGANLGLCLNQSEMVAGNRMAKACQKSTLLVAKSEGRVASERCQKMTMRWADYNRLSPRWTVGNEGRNHRSPWLSKISISKSWKRLIVKDRPQNSLTKMRKSFKNFIIGQKRKSSILTS